jgi:cell division protein FtsB
MGGPANLLRKQVVSELKKRRLIFFTLILLSFIYFGITLLFDDMGILRYKELKKTRAQIGTQIKEIKKENEQLRSEVKSLKEDPFYTEKHAREKFGMSKSDEYIFQYDR